MGFFEILSIVPWLLATTGAFVPFIVYVVSRWREDKGGPPDPYLGFATVYGLVAYVGFEVVIAGLCVLFGELFEGGSIKLGFPVALIVSGAIVFAGGYLPVKAKTASAPSRASRLYAGLAIMGSTLLTAVLVIVVTVMIAMESKGRELAQPLAVLLVNLPVAIAGGVVLARPRRTVA